MSDKDGVEAQLQQMIAEGGQGIDLDTPFHWVIENLKSPSAFFQHLSALLPPESVLYVEGLQVAADVSAFYSAHRPSHLTPVVRDTISPPPVIYHFSFSAEVCAQLQRYAENRPLDEMFHHLKAYHAGKLLFTFHDAFSGWLRVSEHVPAETVENFARLVGSSARREETQRRDPEQLRRFLRLWQQGPAALIRLPWYIRFWRWITFRS